MTRLITTVNKIINQKRVMFMFMFTSRSVQDNYRPRHESVTLTSILYHALSQRDKSIIFIEFYFKIVIMCFVES